MRGFERARNALLTIVAGAALLALPASANAGVLVESAPPGCDNGPISKPFAQWGDGHDYFLARGGNFEGSLDDWKLNRARVVDDQEPWRVHGDDGSHALEISRGGSALTPTMCVGLEHPTMRFFAHREGGGLL
jgi:hypothetical protein